LNNSIVKKRLNNFLEKRLKRTKLKLSDAAAFGEELEVGV